MITRMITGITVHSTSTVVLWVNLRGVGLRFSEKRNITYAKRPNTKTVIPAATGKRNQSLNQWIISMVGLAAGRKPVCQFSGPPAAASSPDQAASAVEAATTDAVTTDHRLRIAMLELSLSFGGQCRRDAPARRDRPTRFAPTFAAPKIARNLTQLPRPHKSESWR